MLQQNNNRVIHWLWEWVQSLNYNETYAKNELQHELNRREYVWRLVFFASTCLGIFQIEKIYIFHTDIEYSQIPKTEIFDLFGSLLVIALIIGSRWIVKQSLSSRIGRHIEQLHLKESGEEIVCERIVQLFFQGVMSLWGYALIRDVEYRWQIDSYEQLFKEKHYTNQLFSESSLQIRGYYVIQIGYNIFFFGETYFCKLENKKYYECLLHHGIAILLLLYSYMFNLLVIGLYVLFWHNLTDIGLLLARTYTLLCNRKIYFTYTLYLLEYSLWIYARNYIFPFKIIYYAVQYYPLVATHLIFAWPIFYLIFLMIALAAMHFYWTYFITQALLYMILERREYNTYDDGQDIKRR